MKKIVFAAIVIGFSTVTSVGFAQTYGSRSCSRSQGSCLSYPPQYQQYRTSTRGILPSCKPDQFDPGFDDFGPDGLGQDNFDSPGQGALDPIRDPGFDDPTFDGPGTEDDFNDPILNVNRNETSSRLATPSQRMRPSMALRLQMQQRVFNNASDVMDFRSRLRQRRIQNSVVRVGRMFVVSYLIQSADGINQSRRQSGLPSMSRSALPVRSRASSNSTQNRR